MVLIFLQGRCQIIGSIPLINLIVFARLVDGSRGVVPGHPSGGACLELTLTTPLGDGIGAFSPIGTMEAHGLGFIHIKRVLIIEKHQDMLRMVVGAVLRRFDHIRNPIPGPDALQIVEIGLVELHPERPASVVLRAAVIHRE